MSEFVSSSLFFGAALSLAAFEAGTLLKKKLKLSLFNPLLVSIILVIVVLLVFIKKVHLL